MAGMMKFWYVPVALLALSSCDSTKHAEEIAELETDLEEIIEQANERGDEYGQIISDLKDENRELAKSAKEAAKKQKAAEDELGETRKDFEDYRKGATKAIEQYLGKIRKNGIGDKLVSHRLGGVLYEDLEIIAVNVEEIRVKHRTGFIALDKNSAPPQWAEKYFLEKSDFVSSEEPKAPEMAEGDEEEPVAPAKGATFDPKKAIVVIEGDDGSGTGFFARSGGRVYLYTAAHVLSGNKKLTVKTISGQEYRKFGKLEVASDVDMVRMRVIGKVPHALDLTSTGGVRQDLKIQALGNSGGGAVINDSEGVVQAVGAESFEISAEVIQGNSGGPIIRKGTTIVLGLVTHGIEARNDVWASNTRFTKVRRFGARLDREIEWSEMPLYEFLKEPDLLYEFDKTTRLIFALSVLRPTENGLRLSTMVNGRMSALQIFNENAEMPAVKELIKMNTELANKKIKPDFTGVQRGFAAYYRGIVEGSARQVVGLRSLSPYHREIAKGSLEARKEAHEELTKLLKLIED